MMLPKSEYHVKALVWNCCVILFLWLALQPESSVFAESKRLKSRLHRVRNNHGQFGRSYPYSNGRTVHRGRVAEAHKKHSKPVHGKHGHFLPKSSTEAKTEKIRQAIINIPDLFHILTPEKYRSRTHDLLSPPDHLYFSGTVRRRRLYCRGGIGYHLEIRSNGKVVGRHKPTDEGILTIFSVKKGVVGIRGEMSHRYLCMNKRGKLYTSMSFKPDCEFLETIEENNFNTYASKSYSDHENRTGFYLSLTKKGKARSNRKTSPWQKKAHWLPRHVNG